MFRSTDRMGVWLGALGLIGGCSVGPISFERDHTTIIATTTANTTAVTICSPPGGLLTCDMDVGFHVSLGGQNLAAAPQLLGMLEADFTADATGMQVIVTRDGDGAVATVTVPPRFTVATPTATSRASGLVVRWDPPSSGTVMRLSLDMSCPSVGLGVDSAESDADTGELTVGGAAFSDVPAMEVCPTTVTLSREQVGVVGEAFTPGSEITGRQVQTSGEFSLTP